MTRSIATACVLLLCWSCVSDGPESVAPDHSQRAAAPTGVADSHAAQQAARDTVLQAALAAADYELVGPHVLWSPFLCSAPPAPSVRHSAAPADTGHGRKLYVLRSNDAETYLKHLHGDPLAVEANAAVEGPVSIPVGLTLVKQAFAPEPYDGEPPPEVTVYGSRDGLVDGYYPYSERKGRVYRTGEPIGSFVMVKVAPDTPDSERGWIYGTVTPDGEVTSAGRVESCLSCHRKAGDESLFGVEFD